MVNFNKNTVFCAFFVDLHLIINNICGIIIYTIFYVRGVHMNIIKRNGSQASYNGDKIRIAISKANATVPEDERLNEQDILDFGGIE